MQKPTQAQRQAQSQRDKALAKSGMQNYSRAERKLAGRPLPAVPARPRMIRVIPKNPAERVQTDLAPGLRNRGRESFLGENVTFDEYIQDINGSVAFAATKFAVQPGLAATFPKGAIKAALYSEWKMVNCEFYFKPEVSQFAGQGSTGKVILAMDYNAGNPAPTTKQQVEIMHVEDAMPYNVIRLRLDASCVNKADSKYIRTGPAPADEDIKTFDGGNLWVCTIGQAGGGLVGELHARYNFRCTKPTLLNPAQGGLIPQTTAAVYTQHAATTFATTVAKAIVFDTAEADGIPVGAPSAAGVFTPPAGNYLVCVNASLSDGTDELWTGTLELQKNSASLVTPCKSQVELVTGGSAIQNVVVRGVISCSGADTVRALVTMVGAAGSLTCIADTAQISFQAL